MHPWLPNTDRTDAGEQSASRQVAVAYDLPMIAFVAEMRVRVDPVAHLRFDGLR
jgi:hypothetical protein